MRLVEKLSDQHVVTSDMNFPSTIKFPLSKAKRSGLSRAPAPRNTVQPFRWEHTVRSSCPFVRLSSLIFALRQSCTVVRRIRQIWLFQIDSYKVHRKEQRWPHLRFACAARRSSLHTLFCASQTLQSAKFSRRFLMVSLGWSQCQPREQASRGKTQHEKIVPQGSGDQEQAKRSGKK